MDILIVIVAIWFILLGIYGAFVLPGGEKRVRTVGSHRGGTALFHAAFASSRKVKERQPQTRATTRTVRPAPETPRPAMNRPGESMVRELRPQATGLFTEVDMLRAQVEELRSEIAALSGPSARTERPRTRRSGVGLYTHLPRLLRRQVREVRSVRRPLLRA
ncbi:MAG: hypothetical protein GEU75_15095 [Dehalococcoidia bacterium]|nr:hypothetical protein [Dehalococcoidia bacterium]